MRKTLASLLAAALVFVPLLTVAGSVSAVDLLQPACDQAKVTSPNTEPGICEDNKTDDAGNPITGLLKVVVNMLSFAGGVIAVIMIIVAALRFTTSGGDSSSIAAARRSLIFAIVGLVIVAVAQFVVPFVITRI